eukprot:1149723-Pelagomonas_calceolata.AAC.1
MMAAFDVPANNSGAEDRIEDRERSNHTFCMGTCVKGSKEAYSAELIYLLGTKRIGQPRGQFCVIKEQSCAWQFASGKHDQLQRFSACISLTAAHHI